MNIQTTTLTILKNVFMRITFFSFAFGKMIILYAKYLFLYDTEYKGKCSSGQQLKKEKITRILYRYLNLIKMKIAQAYINSLES